MIDSWLVAHSLPPGHCLPISPKSGSSTPHTRYAGLSNPYQDHSWFIETNIMTVSRCFRSLSTGSRSTGSGGATPIRKISAQVREKKIKPCFPETKTQNFFRSLKKVVWPSPGWPQWTAPRPSSPARATTTQPSLPGRSGRSPGQICRV